MLTVTHPVGHPTDVAAPSRQNHPWRRWRVALAWLAASVVLPPGLVACGGSDSVAPTAATSVTAVIGAAGGTIAGPDGVQVVVPEGALTQPTTMSIARSATGAPTTTTVANQPGTIYEFLPHGLVFNKPVTIRMPVPSGASGNSVLMASPGEDWQENDAAVVNGMAEWQRNSLSWGFVPLVCAIPAGSTDPYPCFRPRGWATASATPTTAIAQVVPGHYVNSAGSWEVNAASTVSLTLNYRAAPDCGSPSIKLLHWNPDVPIGTPGRVQIVREQPVSLTLVPVTYPAGTWSSGGGVTMTGEGSSTIDVTSYISAKAGTHAFGFNFSCQRPGHSMSGGGDLVTLIVASVSPSSATYTVGGTVNGLTGAGLVLQNNRANLTPFATNGSFSFSNTVGAGAPYNVAVSTQPTGQTCTVTNGSGTASANVTNVAVDCINTYTLGGTVGGLAGTGLVLQNNGADNLAVIVGGAFAFATPVAAASPYNVTVLTQPSGSTCSVTSGSGTVSANVSNVAVTCVSAGPLAIVANSGVTNGVNGLSVYRVNPSTGVLSFLNNFNAGNTPYAVAVTPNGLFAYVSNQLGDSVSAYGIDNATGVLTPLTGRVSNNASGLAMDHLGRYLWVANYGWHTLSGFAIAGNGALTPVPGSPLATTSSLPYAITAHPTLDFVYVAFQSSFDHSVVAYSVDPATGALTQQQKLTNVISSANGVAIDPNGRFLYVNDGSGICSFAINATTGLLTSKGCVSVGGSTFALAIHPTGNYIYVANTSSNTVAVYAVNLTTGTLTQVGTPAGAGNNPRGVTVNPTGTFLYVTNYVSNDVSTFSISAGGATLTSLGATVPAGSTPQGIAIAP